MTKRRQLQVALSHENGGQDPDRRHRRITTYAIMPDQPTLDQVDVCWEIGGDFHANGLLANLWFVPDLHAYFLQKG